MIPEFLAKLGKRAFVQSLHPYEPRVVNGVAVFGLDTEFVPTTDKPSDLICWQLSSSEESKIFVKPLSIKNIYQESKKMIGMKRAKTYVFVCFFSLAEIQFFNLNEWVISEFKGKYRLSQSYGDGRLIVVDLADWYQHQKLESVAKLWGLKKKEFPIVEKVTAISKGELTKDDLLNDKKFRDYAITDSVICQRVYSRMRNFFQGFGVDIVSTMTPAHTSACMFRSTLTNVIEQRDTNLRSMALKCCWGGRMESFFRGSKDLVREYDATAHHPSSAIALGILPLEKSWKKTTNLNVWLSGHGGIGKVFFKFPLSEKFPCLPVYHLDSLVFPSEGVSFCSLSEVKLALELKAKVVLMEGYFYQDGTDLLTKYLLKIQDIRNKSKDEAERSLLKLLSNSMIGKLFQKKVGIDLALVQKYAAEHQIPFEEAIKVKGVDFGEGQVTVGSCFYPEWYALILGYARASISKVGRDHNALVISSDSFVTLEDLGKMFSWGGIVFNLKVSGDFVSYRTRFYRVGDKLAHHAVHSLDASVKILDKFIEKPLAKYGYFRFMHLKESWKDRKPFGSRTFKPMSVGLGFDYKRVLMKNGTTSPWPNVELRAKYLEHLKSGKSDFSFDSVDIEGGEHGGSGSVYSLLGSNS